MNLGDMQYQAPKLELGNTDYFTMNLLPADNCPMSPLACQKAPLFWTKKISERARLANNIVSRKLTFYS